LDDQGEKGKDLPEGDEVLMHNGGYECRCRAFEGIRVLEWKRHKDGGKDIGESDCGEEDVKVGRRDEESGGGISGRVGMGNRGGKQVKSSAIQSKYCPFLSIPRVETCITS